MSDDLWADAPVGLCVIDARMRCTALNRWAGWPEAAIGPGLVLAVPALVPAMRDVLASGRAIAGLKLDGPDGRTWMCALAPLRGTPNAVSCAITDITDHAAAEQAGLELSREVDHRGQNVLALVLGLLRLSAAAAPDDTARLIAMLDARVQAMARVHNILSREKWMSADLHEIVEAELAAYAGQFTLVGPRLRLSTLAAQKLALVLHELVTNAAEHGALATLAGRLDLTWTRDADGIALSWIERDGARSGPPGAACFGTWLVDSTLAGQLDGRITRTWDAEGLRCDIRLGRAVLAEGADREHGAPLAGRRVLLALDEPAGMLAAALREAGCTVLALPGDTQEAIAIAVAAGTVDAAVVAASMGGRSTQPLVAMLRRRTLALVHVAPLAPVPDGLAHEIVLPGTGGPACLCGSVMAALHRLLAPSHPDGNRLAR